MIEISKKSECCGCTACMNICPKKCIVMVEDDEGFLYPEVDKEKCIDCNLCKKVCPIINKTNVAVNIRQSAAIVQHKDEIICKQSTSGGAFSAIAEYVIDSGGVVFGVTMLPDFTVQHIYVERKEEVYKFRNSKYVQSNIGESYAQVKDFLRSGRLVCFSGTPCQIEGLISYLGEVDEKLILVDVVCRAVPSPGVWRMYVNYMQKKTGGLKSVRFRDKKLGYQYSTMEIVDINGRIERGGIESQKWLRMFFSGMIIRPSCAECKFRSRYRYSDFTLWDCFNIHKIDHDFDENIGTTRMLIHTSKAMDIYKDLSKSIKTKLILPDLAVKDVKELVESPQIHSNRIEFFKDLNNLEMEFVLNKYFPDTLLVKLKKIVRISLNRVGLDVIIKRIIKR